MSDFEQVKVFIDGAKTALDWMHHKGVGYKGEPSEYENGFRHCLDAIGNFMEDLEEEADAKQEPSFVPSDSDSYEGIKE